MSLTSWKERGSGLRTYRVMSCFLICRHISIWWRSSNMYWEYCTVKAIFVYAVYTAHWNNFIAMKLIENHQLKGERVTSYSLVACTICAEMEGVEAVGKEGKKRETDRGQQRGEGKIDGR